MPTKKNHQDAELSALLRQAEPPRSPEHLDETIISYAREKAPEPVVRPAFQFLSPGRQWLNRNWVSAAATLSIAVIAVSVSLPIFNPAVDNRGFEADLIASRNEALKVSEPASVLADSDQSRENSAPEPSIITETVSGVSVSADDVAQQVVEARREIASTANVALENVGARSAPPADLIDADAKVAEAEVETEEELNEVVVTGANLRQQSFNAASPAAPLIDTQYTTLINNSENRRLFIEVLRQVLAGSDQNEISVPVSAANETEITLQLITTYSDINGSQSIAAAEDRYTQAKAEFTAFEIPESLAAAIDLLRILEF